MESVYISNETYGESISIPKCYYTSYILETYSFKIKSFKFYHFVNINFNTIEFVSK